VAFLVVPRSCLEHSFHLDADSWGDALQAVGLAIDEAHNTEKLSFFVCIATKPSENAGAAFKVRGKPEAAKNGRMSRGADFNIVLDA